MSKKLFVVVEKGIRGVTEDKVAHVFDDIEQLRYCFSGEWLVRVPKSVSTPRVSTSAHLLVNGGTIFLNSSLRTMVITVTEITEYIEVKREKEIREMRSKRK